MPLEGTSNLIKGNTKFSIAHDEERGAGSGHIRDSIRLQGYRVTVAPSSHSVVKRGGIKPF